MHHTSSKVAIGWEGVLSSDAEQTPRRRGSKAGRNEARKLAGTFSNNVGVAFFLAAFLQPAVSFVQQSRPPSLAGVIASAIFFMLAMSAFLTGQAIARRLED